MNWNMDIDRLISEHNNQPVVLMETLCSDHPRNKSLLFLNPIRIISAHSYSEVTSVISAVEQFQRSGHYVAGYITYEAGYALDPVFEPFCNDAEFKSPIVWFGIYDSPPIDFTSERIKNSEFNRDDARIYSMKEWMNVTDYQNNISQIKDYIASGDVYQINYTGKFEFDPPVSGYYCYRMLAGRQQVSYAAYIRHDDKEIVSLSPELFFRIENGRITSRPMKGTIHRGRTKKENETLATTLQNSVKNRAENVMIVDLIRNDLGKVCEAGSVTVPELFTVETYDTIIQMTSTVEGDLKEHIGIADVFQSLFPCGSITGAPKIRAMELIHDLETEPRGVYTGAIGYLTPNGDAVFSVAIRTLELDGKKGSMGIGSGIVWDSDATDEYDECILKRSFLVSDMPNKPDEFSLIETMCCKKGRIRLLSLHLDRIMDSASYFLIDITRENIEQKIRAYIADLNSHKKFKVRLLLFRDGVITITSEELHNQNDHQKPLIGIASHMTYSANRFLYHKTTERQLYSDLYAFSQIHGLYDILVTNENGKITEGCISNVFIKCDGSYITPPVTCGLLNGVMRRFLLNKCPSIVEKPITMDDVLNADRVFLTNAVRGIREVAVCTETIDFSQVHTEIE